MSYILTKRIAFTALCLIIASLVVIPALLLFVNRGKTCFSFNIANILSCKLDPDPILKSFGLNQTENEKLIHHLISEGYSCACRMRIDYSGVDKSVSGYYVYKGQDDRICKMLFGSHVSGIKENDPYPISKNVNETYHCNIYDRPIDIGKPVIYLYPTSVEKVRVHIDFQGKFIATYPNFIEGTSSWDVTAFPDGKIINEIDGKEYSYLFWEGESYDMKVDLSSGFVVSGVDTAVFLQSKLAEIGLTPREYNEFIVYWMPKMKSNQYNLIHFVGKEYSDIAVLEIVPKPESILRIFMVYKPLKEKVKVFPQEFPKFDRNGFTVVEWGGSEIR